MTREAIIQRTLQTLSLLPREKAEEIANFADFILKKHEEQTLQAGIQKLVNDSEAFNFLKNEDDLYSSEDVKERFNG